MAIDKNKYLRIHQNALNKFSGKFMSNSKWLKLFKLVSDNLNIINGYTIIDIYDDIPCFVDAVDLIHFEEVYNTDGIKDVIRRGPMLFKEIRWIELHANDAGFLEKILPQLGELVIEKDENSFKIYGYK